MIALCFVFDDKKKRKLRNGTAKDLVTPVIKVLLRLPNGNHLY